MENISKKLKAENLKVTPQRIAIYKALLETNSHPTAEAIYTSLKEAYPTMSIATVYKTLSSLKTAGLVQELSTGDGSFRYDARTHFHPHLICLNCNSVFDYLGDVSFLEINGNIKTETGFAVKYEQLYFYGECGKCGKNH